MLHFSKMQTILILLLSALGIAFAMPNLVSTMKSWSDPLPNKSLHLGLDLQGGSHLLLEMNSNEIKDSWLDTIRGDALSKLRAAAHALLTRIW